MEFQVYHFDSLDSTNNWLKQNAVQGFIKPGAVVQANFQSDGRGRLGRKWESKSEDGLMFSMLLEPLLPESLLPLIGLLISLGMFDGIAKEIGDTSQLKLRWPNDILYDNKKLSGILCESTHSDDDKKLTIAGIGLNVNQTTADFEGDFRTPATSLHMITGKRSSPAKLLPTFLQSIGFYLDRLETEGWSWVSREWIECSGLTGEHVEVADGNQRIAGIVEEIRVDGALVLNLGRGVRRTVRSGELSS